MTMYKLAKKLRDQGKHELCDELISAFASSSKHSVIPRPDLSYSFIMRNLRKSEDEKRAKEFQKAFKEAYDEAFIEGLENIDDVALLQAIKTIKLKSEEIDETKEEIKKSEAEINYNLTKLGQAASDLGDPEFAGKSIAEIVKFLMRKISFEKRPSSMMSMRQKILQLNEYDMSTKKSPATASMGQSLTLIKTLLNGKDSNYIRATLEQIVRNLV